MTRWKGIGAQRLLWVFVTLLAIGCVAAAAVAGSLYYRSAYQTDLTIDLIPENGYFMERMIPLEPAQARAVTVGAPAMGEGYRAMPPRMGGPIRVEDEYGVVWNTDTRVEIFKTSYENEEGQISVAGENSTKVIAPGTENDYTFSLYNNTGYYVDYKMTMSATVDGVDDPTTLPVEVRVKGANGWVAGDEETWIPVLDLNTAVDTCVSGAHYSAVYTLEWRWPFESGQDELDTWLGNQQQDVTLTIGIATAATFHPVDDDDDEDDVEIDGPTGESGGSGSEVVPPDNPGEAPPAPPVVPPTPPVVPPITEPVPEHLRPAERNEHLAYIYGYEDGTLRPENNITRAEVAAIFYRLTNAESRAQYETTVCQYPDVPEDAWFRREVATMTHMGILEGYPDGWFRPNEPITRAELTTIVARFAEQSWTMSLKSRFSDVDGHWADDHIRNVEDKNWIIGYPDGTFRPDTYITRGETVTIVNRVLHRLPEQFEDLLEDMPTWPDNEDLYKWYYIAMQEAAVSHTCEYIIGTREQWVELLVEITQP